MTIKKGIFISLICGFSSLAFAQSSAARPQNFSSTARSVFSQSINLVGTYTPDVENQYLDFANQILPITQINRRSMWDSRNSTLYKVVEIYEYTSANLCMLYIYDLMESVFVRKMAQWETECSRVTPQFSLLSEGAGIFNILCEPRPLSEMQALNQMHSCIQNPDVSCYTEDFLNYVDAIPRAIVDELAINSLACRDYLEPGPVIPKNPYGTHYSLQKYTIREETRAK